MAEFIALLISIPIWIFEFTACRKINRFIKEEEMANLYDEIYERARKELEEEKQ